MRTIRTGRDPVPEVVQSSAMDCGPAALAAFLNGAGRAASYPRLRELCQTDVDGTSIDVLERLSCELGVPAEQVVVPAEFVTADARNTPSIVVTVLPGGFTHFVVASRVVGGRVGVMDPAVGRRQPTLVDFAAELFEFPLRVAADDWYEWASTDDFLMPMRSRLRHLGVPERSVGVLLEAAVAPGGWEALAAFDAAVRAAERLVAARRCRPGSEASRVVVAALDDPSLIPAPAWRITGVGDNEVVMRGAVVLRRTEPEGAPAAAAAPAQLPASDGDSPQPLRTVLDGAPPSPWRQLWAMTGSRRRLLVGTATALIVCGALRVLEALLFRDAVADPGGSTRDLVAVVITLAVLETLAHSALAGLGRRVELILRAEIGDRVPRLGDAYFRTRAASDLTARAHDVVRVRSAADHLGSALRAFAQLTGTLLALMVVVPSAWLLIVLLGAAAAALPTASVRWLRDVDHRRRTLDGSLSQFHLDGLLGARAIRAAGGERAVVWAHDQVFDAWRRAALAATNRAAKISGSAEAVTLLLAIWITLHAFGRGGAPALLVAFWALSVPVLTAELSQFARGLPQVRSTLVRLLEPLTAPAEPASPLVDEAMRTGSDAVRSAAVALHFDAVSVDAGGHRVLDRVDLEILAGEHVAIVGASGSGKSTLIGTLLGFHAVAEGELRVDGNPLDQHALGALRRRTAWVDPQVAVFDRSVRDNVSFGASSSASATIEAAVRDAELVEVMGRVGPMPLGDAGGRLSGGERQRVRLARGLARDEAGLVLLDEAFRGVDRAQRQRLLCRTRRRFSRSTLLYVSHDIGHALDFGRVVVLAGGAVVEDGDPSALAADPSSTFRRLLDAEAQLASGGSDWRRLTMERGRLSEGARRG